MSQHIVGLITEYNPFHNGHLYHAIQAKKLTGAGAVVAVMSGSFVQRGEPALLDKWTRAACAIENGVDLVIEIPAAFATSSAEYFATAGVYLLDQLGVVDSLCFGSETGSLKPLQTAAVQTHFLETEMRNIRKVKPELNYPAMRDLLLRKHAGLTISMPNDILAIEYIKALSHFNSKIEPVSIKRSGKNYNDKTMSGIEPMAVLEFSSATAIRHALAEGDPLKSISKAVPEDSYRAIQSALNRTPDPDRLYLMLAYRLLTHTPESLRTIHDIEPGLEYRILDAIKHSTNLDSLISAIKSKRHTRTRIQRILTKILLEIPADYLSKNRSALPTYLRILGFNSIGRDVLNTAKKISRLPLLTRVTPQNLLDQRMGKSLKIDLLSTELRELCCGNPSNNLDLITPPVFIK